VMFLVCRIIRPVVVLSDVARQIAAGDIESAQQALVPLDTRSSGAVQAKDEVLQLVVSMSEMTDRLGKLVGHVKTAAGSLDTSANTISGQTRDLEATTTEQAASTHQSIASAKQIAATSQILLETMTEVASATGETESAVGQSKEELSRIHQAMLNLESATSTMGGRLDHIAEHADEIGGIIVTIIQIADRTNLLSLNAAIQAEEAGEHGRGFAVVAEEIRHLADQTAEATLQIESLIGEMQKAVTDGVDEMKQLSSRSEAMFAPYKPPANKSDT
jgi:methyl-accepting chemotaxis protein WspA